MQVRNGEIVVLCSWFTFVQCERGSQSSNMEQRLPQDLRAFAGCISVCVTEGFL